MIKLIFFIVLSFELYSLTTKASFCLNWVQEEGNRSSNGLCELKSLNNLSVLNFCCFDSKINIFNNHSHFPIGYKISEQIDVQEYDIYKEFKRYDNIVMKPTEFVNDNIDLNFIINVKSIRFQELRFNMEDNSKLTLNFLLNDDMLIQEGKPILITGDEETSNVVINMHNNSNNKKYTLELKTGINSELRSELSIKNIKLFIQKGIKFYEDNNKVLIKNSLVQGKIEFFGKQNEILVNNTSFQNCKFEFKNENNKLIFDGVDILSSEYVFNNKDNLLEFNNITCDDKSKIILNSSNNEINITGCFKGYIDLLQDHTIITFKDSKVKNTVINFNKSNTLDFINSYIKDSYIKFNDKGNNYITFNNSHNTAYFSFNNDGINYINFRESSNNIMDGIIEISHNQDKSSVLNFNFEKNSKTELSMLVKGTINEFNISPFSEILLKNQDTLYINQFNCPRELTLGFYLDYSQQFVLYIKNHNFNKDSIININIYHIRDLLGSDVNEKEYKILKAGADLNKNLDIKLNTNLSNYYIKMKNNEIILVIKKHEHDSIINIIKKYYQSDKSLFKRKDVLSLAEYLDLLVLSKLDNLSKIDPIIDYLYLCNNITKFNTFLSSLFPVSNNIFYRASYDTTLNFLDEVNSRNSKNITYDRNIWYSIFHLEDNFVLGNSKTANINLVGNAVALGVVYPINNYLDTGVSLGFSYNNINKYFYDIDLFVVNLATHTKICLTDRLCNFSTVSLNLHYFDTQRNVVMYDYDSLNCSSPIIKNFIFYNILSYSRDVLKHQNITFNVTPNFKMALGKMLLSDYHESGKESLSVKGFNIFTNTTEIGITSTIGIQLTKAYLKTNLSINTGYEFNNLKSTIFSFADIKNISQAKLDDYNNKQSYFKLDTGLVYTPINNIYDINLLLSYKKSKLSNNTKISVAVSFRF